MWKNCGKVTKSTIRFVEELERAGKLEYFLQGV